MDQEREERNNNKIQKPKCSVAYERINVYEPYEDIRTQSSNILDACDIIRTSSPIHPRSPESQKLKSYDKESLGLTEEQKSNHHQKQSESRILKYYDEDKDDKEVKEGSTRKLDITGAHFL